MPDFSAEARAFIGFWMSLQRVEAGVPASADFLDATNPAVQPYVSFNDVDTLAQRNRVALYGTALVEQWGEDLTGYVVEGRFAPEVAARFRRQLITCAHHPCGLWELSELATSTGRVIRREITSLPLAIKSPHVIRVARLHRLIERMGQVENFTGVVHVIQRQWFDLGRGIPAAPPEVGRAIRLADGDTAS